MAGERKLWLHGQQALAAGTEARARQKRAAARSARANAARRLAWCPPVLLPEYIALTRKGLTAAEARAALQAEVAAFSLTFEGQMWKLTAGRARLVPNVKIERAAALTTSAYGEAMT